MWNEVTPSRQEKVWKQTWRKQNTTTRRRIRRFIDDVACPKSRSKKTRRTRKHFETGGKKGVHVHLPKTPAFTRAAGAALLGRGQEHRDRAGRLEACQRHPSESP